ncbi:caspase family protein [Leptolyngbya sp. FACHB-60]|uniref:nSTAND1 domain-containing NTPase n=1 Tax=unclassified Leptolyngbya TaxID=2650499 RepID=UPI0016893CA7|nr:caspase family protein [Leptolyngbya sp. FACHB-60]MBD2049589.1 caspase family protein [Leptolyngbya sp. FACHB-60]
MKNFDRKLAIVIGINQYHHGIAPLQTAVQDAQVLAATLKNDHGYQVVELLDEVATLTGLRQLFKEKLPQTVTDQDCLLIYFAGHGIAKQASLNASKTGSPETEGPMGYLIPQDARPEDESTFLPMQKMYKALEKLPCRHFLLILDCCFAGAFRWASTRDLVVPERMYRERFLRFQSEPAWQVLTSASYDQKALDILRDNRGTTQGDRDHSPFAMALFEALAGKADLISDQVITATELYLYLRDSVETKSKERQTPGLWPLPKHDRGEFFFLASDFDAEKLEPAPTLNPDNNPYRGLQAYEERHGNLFFGRDKLIKRLYTDHIKTNSLTVVVGASGTGKSSLVKAGLVPFLKRASFFERRREFKDTEVWVTESWVTLPTLRPGNDPLSALAQMMLPFAQELAETVALHAEALTALTAFQTVVQARQADLSKSFLKAWNSLEQRPKAQMTLALEWAKTLENWLTRHSSEGSTRVGEADQAKLNALISATQAYVQHLTQQLKQDDTLLKTLLSDWLGQNPQSHLLLVVDQAEELITQVRDEEVRQRFVHHLESALAAFPQRLHAVLTVRMDFEPLVMQLFSQPWQTGWTEKYRLVVPPMTQDDLRQAIEGPANEAVLHFDPASLVDELINEVVQMPGALPLLSFVLSELYLKCAERWREDKPDRALKQKDYEQLGKVSGALRHRANAEFDALDEVGQRTLRNIMLRMVVFEGGELARRRVPRTELVYSEARENERVEAILNLLIEQRLVMAGRSADGEYVEPAHDVLVRGWEKIAEWLKEEVEVQREPSIRERLLSDVFLKQVRKNRKKSEIVKQLKFDPTLQRHVTEASEQWLSNRGQRREYEYLWTRDPRLAQLRQVQRQQGHESNWLNQQENGFVKKSIDRKDKLFQRWVLGTTGVLAVIISVAGIAVYQGAQAVKESRKAQRQTVQTLNQAASTYLASDKPFEALLEATKAGNLIQQNSYFEKDHELIVQIWAQLYASGTRVKEISIFQNIRDFKFSPNGQYLASGGYDGDVKLWRTDGTVVALPDNQDEGGVGQLTFSPDGQYLASGGDSDGDVKLWRTDGTAVALPDNQHEGGVWQLTFSPDGQYLASGGADGDVKLWRTDGTAVALPDNQHEGEVRQLTFSPDGQYLASGGADGDVKLWRTDSTVVALPDNQHEGEVRQLTFSPDGQYLASGGADGDVKLWRTDGTVVALPDNQHEGGVWQLTFSPDGQYLASGGADGDVKLWRTDSTVVALPDNQHEEEVGQLTFSPDGQYLASGGYSDGGVKLWRTDGTAVALPDNQHGGVGQLTFSPDGQYLTSGNSDGVVKLWRTDGTAVALPNNQHEGGVWQLTFSPDGQYLASGGDSDGVVKLWRTDGTAVALPDNQHESGVGQLTFSPDGQYLASGGSDGDVKLWRTDGTAVALPDNQHESGVGQLTFSPDGQYLASRGADGDVKLWRTDGTAVALPNNQHEGEVWQLTFSPDGQYLASGGADGDVKLWRTDGTAVALPDNQHEGGVWQLTFSPDGQYLASGGADGDVKLWRTDGTAVALPDNQHEGEVWQLTFSPDGQYLASGGADGDVKLWRTDGTVVALPDNQHGGVGQLMFSPDGQYLASGGDSDGVVKLWRTDGTVVALPDNQHEGAVRQLAFSPDGQYLASGGADGDVKLWRTDGTAVALPDNQHEGGVRQLTFSPDGQYLASGGDEGVVKLWRTDGTVVTLPNNQHEGAVRQLTFSPDSQYLASGGDEGVVKLWRTDGTAVALPDNQHEGGVWQLTFSPDGQYLASGGADGDVKLWPLEFSYLMEKSCDWLQFYINAHPEEKEELCPEPAVSESDNKQMTTSFSGVPEQLSQAVAKLSLPNIRKQT